MPAHRTTLSPGVLEPLTPDRVGTWLGRAGLALPNDPDAQELLQVFLRRSDKTWGFMQAAEFLAAFESYVDQIAVLRAVNDVCADILRDYPPAVYLYVGMGRSAAPFLASLANQQARTVSIPLSGFRVASLDTSVTDDFMMRGIPARARITAPQLNLLFNHFDQRFGPGALPRGRILMIDYTEGGQAVVAAQEVLQAWVNARRHGAAEVHTLAICRNSDGPTIRQVGQSIAATRSWFWNPVDYWFWSGSRTAFGQRWHVYPLGAFLGPLSRRHRVLAKALHDESFEGVAAYGSYKVLDTPTPPLTDYQVLHGDAAGYEALRLALRRA